MDKVVEAMARAIAVSVGRKSCDWAPFRAHARAAIAAARDAGYVLAPVVAPTPPPRPPA